MDWNKIKQPRPTCPFTPERCERIAQAIAASLEELTGSNQPLGYKITILDETTGEITVDTTEPAPPHIVMRPEINPEAAMETLRLTVLDALYASGDDQSVPE